MYTNAMKCDVCGKTARIDDELKDNSLQLAGWYHIVPSYSELYPKDVCSLVCADKLLGSPLSYMVSPPPRKPLRNEVTDKHMADILRTARHQRERDRFSTECEPDGKTSESPKREPIFTDANGTPCYEGDRLVVFLEGSYDSAVLYDERCGVSIVDDMGSLMDLNNHWALFRRAKAEATSNA